MGVHVRSTQRVCLVGKPKKNPKAPIPCVPCWQSSSSFWFSGVDFQHYSNNRITQTELCLNWWYETLIHSQLVLFFDFNNLTNLWKMNLIYKEKNWFNLFLFPFCLVYLLQLVLKQAVIGQASRVESPLEATII